METDARELAILRGFVARAAKACGLDDNVSPDDVIAAVTVLYRQTHREPGPFTVDCSKRWQDQ